MFTVKMSKTFDNDQIAGLLCTGWEGGMTTQWARVVNKKQPKKLAGFKSNWNEYPLYSYPLGNGGLVTIEDTETGKLYNLTSMSIKRGLKIMAEKYPKHFTDFVEDNEDAITGDVFIQCCVLGDVVYG